MVYIGGAGVSLFLGLFALKLVLSDQRYRNRSHNSHQSWKRTVLLCMLFALELCVLSQVAVFLLLALVEFGVIDSSAEGTWYAFIGFLFFVAPYMMFPVQVLFVFCVLLGFVWRKKRGKAEWPRKEKGVGVVPPENSIHENR